MALTRRRLIQRGAALAGGVALGPLYAGRGARGADASGPFAPTWDSLSGYQAPEWFRDAKFGIWAHWGPQCVPEQGDWYARQMYQQGNHDYDYQCAHYGHPSKAGFKDVAHLWGAEKWDPERLIGLYKRAGAKYFMSLANHHDNFDCFDSKYQTWNAVALGPKRDIVGGWEREVRRAGLRFAVSVHGSRAWSWYEVAQGADATGPLAGVPYDGHLTQADGKGLWWEGLDPQELYAQSHTPGKGLVWSWDASKGSSVPDTAYCEKFYRRTVDLIDQYNPDLIYFDDTVLPLYPISDVGLRIASHYYNANMARHGGRLEAVITGKGLSDAQRQCIVLDIERGRSDRVEPLAWQTDTCIGNWHYQRSLYENHQYKSVNQVVHMLVDIVSKNGNLMLNIPVRGDGTIDPDEETFIAGLTAWMDVNAEAIHATRPWGISGEGVVRERAGSFNEGGDQRFTPADLRFTTRGNTLYATALAWPDDGTITVRTLSSGALGIIGDVRHVELLGHRGSLPFERTPAGLVVHLPKDRQGDYAFALKITGLDLANSAPAPPPPAPATVPA
jgi:alpha-L-fucosidase